MVGSLLRSTKSSATWIWDKYRAFSWALAANRSKSSSTISLPKWEVMTPSTIALICLLIDPPLNFLPTLSLGSNACILSTLNFPFLFTIPSNSSIDGVYIGRLKASTFPPSTFPCTIIPKLTSWVIYVYIYITSRRQKHKI